MDHILLNTSKCTACRACEIACHFHHTSRFGTSSSSIHILYDGDTSDLDIKIDNTCDSCGGLVLPYCVNSCTTGASIVKT